MKVNEDGVKNVVETDYPVCTAHEDCFANKDGKCECLTSNDFGNCDCPFYKKKEGSQSVYRKKMYLLPMKKRSRSLQHVRRKKIRNNGWLREILFYKQIGGLL